MISALLVLACCISAPPEVTIATDSITMGSLIPFGSADARANIALGYAPGPGLARRFLRDEILAKIVSAGFTTDDLRLPDAILVHRAAQTLDRQRVERAVNDAFVRQYPSARVEIASIDVPEIQVGTGSVDLTATIPAHSDPSGPLYVKLDIRGNNVMRTIYVRAQARVDVEQPVIIRPISAQTRISPADVQWQLMPLRGTRDVLTSLDGVEGMVAKRDLEPGTTLSTELLYMPVYVRKGDAVTVKATSGGVTVAATMRAREAGKFGDSIVVEHISGNGTATARIVGPKTLEALQGAK
jgi:flagella basal body P-ring formation protein FlgA